MKLTYGTFTPRSFASDDRSTPCAQAARGFVFRYSVLNDHWGQPLWLALLTLVYISSVSVVRLVHVSVFGGDHRLPLAVITASAVLIIPVSMLVQWRATARYHHIAEERNNARELAQPPNAPGCLVTETFADEPVKPLASQSTQQLDYLNLVITLLAIFKYSILSPCQHTSDHTPIRNAVSWFFTPWVMQGMVLCLGAASRPQLSTQRVHMTLSITAGAILMQACYLLLLRLVIFPQREADVTDGGCLYQVMQYAQAEFVQDSSSHTPLPLTDMLSDLFSPFWHLWILYAHVLWQLIAPYWSHLRWGVTAAVVLATLNGFLVRAYQSPLRAVNYLPFFMAGVGLRNQALLAPALHYMTTPAARVWSAAMLAGHAVVAAVAAHHHMPLEYFTLISDYRQFSDGQGTGTPSYWLLMFARPAGNAASAVLLVAAVGLMPSKDWAIRAAGKTSATLPPYAAAFAAFLLLRRFTPLADDTSWVHAVPLATVMSAVTALLFVPRVNELVTAILNPPLERLGLFEERGTGSGRLAPDDVGDVGPR